MADPNDTPLPATRKEAQATGAMFYAPGSACKEHGHVAKRRTKNGKCFACEQSEAARIVVRQRVKRWRETRDPRWLRGYRAADARKVRANDPERARAKDKRNRAKLDPLVRQALQKSWRKRNAEHVSQYDTAYKKAWRKANPLKASLKTRAADYRRRAREQGAVGTFTDADIAWLLAEQGGKCAGFWCRAVFEDDFTIDHRDPISRGGTNWPANLALLCKSCNSRKSDRTMPEWFLSLGGFDHA